MFWLSFKLEGVEEFIQGIVKYTEIPYPSDFGARVFKIIRDEQGNRLTHMKLLGLKTRDVLSDDKESQSDQIYSGENLKL